METTNRIEGTSRVKGGNDLFFGDLTHMKKKTRKKGARGPETGLLINIRGKGLVHSKDYKTPWGKMWKTQKKGDFVSGFSRITPGWEEGERNPLGGGYFES